jgi:ribonuclease R
MPEIFKDRIVSLLKRRDYEPVKLSQLARALGVCSEDHAQFKEAFEQLRRAGHVVTGAGNLVMLPSMGGQVVGTFSANPRGFGFVRPLEPNAHGDLFVPAGASGKAMTGDVVLAKVNRKGKRAGQTRCSGEVIEILERARNRFVGTLTRHTEGWLVQPDGSSFFEPISVDDVTAKNAKEKDKVVVEIIAYPTEKCLSRGVIVEVLGKAGRYESEAMSIIRQFHLPDEFSDECLEQAREAAAGFDSDRADGYEDITDKVIVTIDPPDAKDFDDAISLERDAQGNWVLGVHIADVSRFVTAGSPLDVEARLRGNSAYLPNKTIPMLPEILSNGICSLQPNQKRLCKSAYLTYDDNGKVLHRRFANSIIRSTQRLTYQQADRILKGRTKDAARRGIALLRDMEALARIIEQRRSDQGMIHLDLPETELEMDDAGQVVDAHPADNSYPHTIIEMFMVEANDAVASLLDRLNVPFIRRIHPEPDAMSMKDLAQMVRGFGLSLPRNPDRRSIQDLLDAVKNRPCSFAVNLTVLRSLEKAQYAPSHIGHYALASTHYCHFTSPIRRYADLMVHRSLDCHIRGAATKSGGDLAKDVTANLDLVEIGKHITFTEQRAEDAEGELKTVLILQMLSKKIGLELECVVSGLTAFGVFVQSQRFGIEGLIRLDDLGPDHWKFDKKTQCVIGERSGREVRLGQPMKARVVAVNVSARQLNVVPVEPLIKPTQATKRRTLQPQRTERLRKRSSRRRS